MARLHATCVCPPSRRSCATWSFRSRPCWNKWRKSEPFHETWRPEARPAPDDAGNASHSEHAGSDDTAWVAGSAMMHLCFAGGLRVSELVGALLANLSLSRTPSLLVEGKGRKQRNLPLWKETATDLRAWLSVRGNILTPELFANAEGKEMTRAGFDTSSTSTPAKPQQPARLCKAAPSLLTNCDIATR